MRDFQPLPGLNLNLLIYCLDSGVHHTLTLSGLCEGDAPAKPLRKFTGPAMIHSPP